MDRVIDREALAEKAVYDHETEPGGTRRRVADWGGDELFHGTVPRRRFRGHNPQPRSLAARRAAEREEAASAAPLHTRRVSGPATPAPAPAPAPQPAAAHEHEPPVMVEPAHEIRNGRKTVTITGHPGALATQVRRRPARTVEERIGSRPDRVAAWAFGMGIGLILIAVSTADAAAL